MFWNNVIQNLEHLWDDVNMSRNMNNAVEPTRLARRLNTTDAVTIGMGSMIGAGVFAVIGPAAQAAGTALLAALFIAGLVAYFNACTMAQLAAIYPESGGTYIYGRKLLGPLPGFLAGWGFIIGKLASCTAMALTFGYYANPEYARVLAVAAVFILTGINCLGVRKTAAANRILLALVLLSLATVAFSALSGGSADISRLKFWDQPLNLKGILQAAGLIFFAFAGYARVATLGEEVIDPRRTIPKAIMMALGSTLVIYAVIFIATLLTVDIGALSQSKFPLVLAVESGRYAGFSAIVRVGACLASLGVLISLMAGISRTAFAMADKKDLPHWLSRVHPVRKVPYRAEIVVGILVALVASILDLRSAIGFSSFAILIYYSIANLACLKLSAPQRLWPRWMSIAGLISCLTVAVSLPWVAIVGGLLLFGIGSAIYFLSRKLSEQSPVQPIFKR